MHKKALSASLRAVEEKLISQRISSQITNTRAQLRWWCECAHSKTPQKNKQTKNQHTPPEAIMHWSQSWEKVLCNSPHIPSKCLEVNMTGNLTVGNESSIHGTKCYKVGASAQTACVPRIPMVSFSVVQKYLLEDFCLKVSRRSV